MMQKYMATTLLLLASGCSFMPIGSDVAICDGTKKARAEHARALLADGGDQSLMTGQVLLSQMDSACP